ASTAVFGLTLAIALAPYLQLRARPDDPLSALKVAGYRPAGSMLQFLLAVLLTALFAIAGERVARLLAEHTWAPECYSIALLAAPLTLMYYGNWHHVLLVGVVAAAIVVFRRHDPHFTIGDVILIPAFLSCYIAFLDTNFGHTPVATALRAAIAIFVVRVIARSSDGFVFTPLALLAEAGWLPRMTGGIIAAVVLLVIPLVWHWLAVHCAQCTVRRALIAYPLIALLYPLALLHGTPPYTFSIFEDSHSLPVATEMMRGERPYRDIVPTHGLVSDGVIDWLGMKAGHGSLDTVRRTRLILGVAGSLATYLLTLAATGSAELALLGAFLAMLLAPDTAIWLRPPVAIFALAATVAAVRLRSRRWFIVAGALVVIAWLFSVDFALYSAVVALFAAFRMRALRALGIGVAAAAIPLLLLFALFGFAGDFLRVTFVELPATHSAYFHYPLSLPEVLRSPAILHHLTSDEAIYAVLWVIALIAACAALARSPFRSRRGDAVWLIAVWMVVATASWVERGNNYFHVAMMPFVVAALYILARRSRPAAIALTIAIVLLAQPFRHVITLIPELHAIQAPPLFDERADRSIRAARHFDATLAKGETFVDFSNAAITYSLLGRDCPLRYVEAANYQPEAMQRDVIRTIEQNQHIRAALIAFPGTDSWVDGVPNQNRAPLVWAYLQKNFAPSFNEDGVEFWRRR
ncbi:MAG TPA: hypothetical protein VH087_03745, partial [Thermoanaerobaculia bacterium]|nr:hypothetical protein [Thermoanaerobaculia bacterium]